MKRHQVAALLVATLVLSASVPESAPAYVDDVDLLLEQSEITMSELTIASAKVDRVVEETVIEMREQIVTLEEEKEELLQENTMLEKAVEISKQIYNEMVTKYESAPVKQFDVLAILPDSTSRG